MLAKDGTAAPKTESGPATGPSLKEPTRSSAPGSPVVAAPADPSDKPHHARDRERDEHLVAERMYEAPRIA
jgi:hypothetical protein